jgi:acyl carrier protein
MSGEFTEWDARDVGMEIRRLIKRHAVSSWEMSDLPDDLPLVDSGLGLDSVGVVELLVACEERFRIPFPADVLEGTPLTVGKLIDHVCQNRQLYGSDGT